MKIHDKTAIKAAGTIVKYCTARNNHCYKCPFLAGPYCIFKLHNSLDSLKLLVARNISGGRNKSKKTKSKVGGKE